MASKKLKKQVYHYTAVFESDPDGGYTVTIPTLPGCISEGDTFEKALLNIREAATLYLESEEKEPTADSTVIIAPVEVTV